VHRKVDHKKKLYRGREVASIRIILWRPLWGRRVVVHTNSLIKDITLINKELEDRINKDTFSTWAPLITMLNSQWDLHRE
jgi:hypothetical protein